MREELRKYKAVVWTESSNTADDKRAIPPRLLAARKKLITALQNLQQRDDIIESLTVERYILDAELADHGNSPIMIQSLNNAIDDLNAALRMKTRLSAGLKAGRYCTGAK